MTPDTESAAPQPPSRLETRDWWCMAMLVLLAVGLFLPSLRYEFLNWDDNEYIAYNPWIRNLSWENIRGVFFHPYFVNYHPLTMLVYMVVFYNFGGAPEAFRIVNLFFHGGSVAILFAVLRMLGSRRDAALAFAVFFAVHPLRVESVVWVSELKDVMCGFFYLLSLGFWVRGANGTAALNRWHPAAAASCIAAMLAKSMATTLPAVLLLHDFLLDRKSLTRRLPVHALMLLLSISCMKINLSAQEGAISSTMSRRSAVGMAVYAPAHYAMKTVAPANLCPLYSMDERPSRKPLAVGVGVLLCAACLGLAFWGFRKQPVLSFSLLAAAIALAPVSMIIPFGQAWAADRYSYIPTALLFCGLAAMSSDFMNVRAGARKAFCIGSMLVGVVLAGITLKYMPTWRNNESVTDRILASFPKESAALINKRHDSIVLNGTADKSNDGGDDVAAVPLGGAGGNLDAAEGLNATQLIRDGKVDEGLAMMRGMKNHAYGLSLASWHADRLGRSAEAMKDARELAGIGEKGGAKPRELAQAARLLAKYGDLDAAAAVVNSFDVPVFGLDEAAGMLANQYLARGDLENCLKYARRGLRVHPANRRAISALGNALLVQKQFDEADAAIRKALRHPEISELGIRYCESALGRIAVQEGDMAAAKEHFDRAFVIEDESALLPDDWYYIGTLADQSRQYPMAEKFYRNTLAANAKHRDALVNLAYVLMQLRKVDEAVTVLEDAAEVYPSDSAIAKNLEMVRDAKKKMGNPDTAGS